MLQLMLRLHELPERQKIEILLGQLEDAAKREVRTWPENIKGTIEQVFGRLGCMFDIHTLSKLKQRLFCTVQSPAESVREYTLELQETLQAIEKIELHEVQDTNKMLKGKFVEGLYNDT